MKLKLSLLTVVGMALMMMATFGATGSSAQGNGAQLTIINYVGDTLYFTLNDQLYQIPGSDQAPGGGQMTFDLAAPARYAYSGHIPGVRGNNQDIELQPGQHVVKGVVLGRTGPKINAQGIVLEEPVDEVVFIEASLTPAATPTPVTFAPLHPLPAGQGALVVDNYIGDELTLDIAGTLYRVAPQSRLQIDLDPGLIKYSAAAATSGIGGEEIIVAGRYNGLGFNREVRTGEPDYDVGELEPTPVPLAMWTVHLDLSNEPVVTSGEPAASPAGQAAAGPNRLPDTGAKNLPGGLTVANYIGEAVTFTIADQTYTVPASGGELTLDLAPGEYTFTASVPRASNNGTVTVGSATNGRISVTLNGAGDQVVLYIE